MPRKFRVKVEDKEYIVEVEELDAVTAGKPHDEPTVRNTKHPAKDDRVATKRTNKKGTEETPKKVDKPAPRGASLVSPMSGTILDVLASVGDSVKKGDKLIILEAMKMENTVLSEHEGVIDEIRVAKGDSVDAGDVLIVFE